MKSHHTQSWKILDFLLNPAQATVLLKKNFQHEKFQINSKLRAAPEKGSTFFSLSHLSRCYIFEGILIFINSMEFSINRILRTYPLLEFRNFCRIMIIGQWRIEAEIEIFEKFYLQHEIPER
jgi:hypothetical protein